MVRDTVNFVRDDTLFCCTLRPLKHLNGQSTTRINWELASGRPRRLIACGSALGRNAAVKQAKIFVSNHSTSAGS